MKVTDTVNSKSSIARITVYPGDSPPQVTIASPPSSETWAVGQAIKFSGSAKAEAGAGAAIAGHQPDYWKTRLLHCPFNPTECHEHPLQVFPANGLG